MAKASIDTLAELGYLSSCMEMMTLLECIKSARWPDDGPLSILPGVNVGNERYRIEKIKSAPTTTAEIGKLSNNELTFAMKQAQVPQDMEEQVTLAASILPYLTHSISSTTALSLSLTLMRQNPSVSNPKFQTWAPKFPKPQTEGWFAIVADEERDEILALKRVGWDSNSGNSTSKSGWGKQGHRKPVNSAGKSGEGSQGHKEPMNTTGKSGGGNQGHKEPMNTTGKSRGGSQGYKKPIANCTLKLPETAVERAVSILVVSDAYIGMVFRVDGVKVPAPSKERGQKAGWGGEVHAAATSSLD